MSKVNVRYIVHDVPTAIGFYADLLGFKLDMHPAPGFASLSRGDLQLLRFSLSLRSPPHSSHRSILARIRWSPSR